MSGVSDLRAHVQQQIQAESLVGKGAFGQVYEVECLDGQQLALKVSSLPEATDKEEQYLRQEVENLAGLGHAHIVHYIDGWWRREKGGQLRIYLLTEFASGKDLRTFLNETLCKAPEEDVYGSWLAQIASALHHIHNQQLVHRNLKTTNVLVCVQGRHPAVLKICDFGMSKVLESKDAMAKSIVGTPFFMSPEILNGIKYNTKTDIWSFGCIAYEVATLCSLFSVSSLTTLISGVNRDEAANIVKKINYGDFFKTLVQRMLSHDYRRRPDASTILQELQDSGYTPSGSSGTLVQYSSASSCIYERCLSAKSSPSNARGISQTGSSKSGSYQGHSKSSSRSTPVRGAEVGSSGKADQAQSIDSLSSMTSPDSMVVYDRSNPSWGQIDKRSERREGRKKSERSDKSGIVRTVSEGSTGSDIGDVLVAFSQERRTMKKGEERLSKSGPVKSVSFDSPPDRETLQRSYKEGLYSHSGDDSDVDDEAEEEEEEGNAVSLQESEKDQDRILSQIETTQRSLSRTLGPAVFAVAFNTLRIQEEDEMLCELQNVLGDKFDTFGLQFVNLRLLEQRFTRFDDVTKVKGTNLNKTI